MSNPSLYRDFECRLDPGDGRTISGLAMPFGKRATIHDHPSGPYTEEFALGAFRKTLAERGHLIRLFFQHDREKLPIGKPVELREASDGLRVSFRISDTQAGNDTLSLIRDGVVSGLSVGFTPVSHKESRSGHVVRTAVSLREVSVVHSPAYADALISSVRFAAGDVLVRLQQLRDGDPKAPYGPPSKVTYADPGNQDGKRRYPLDSPEHCRAAISYLSMPKNAAKYSKEQLAQMWSRIRSAAKRFGIELSKDHGPRYQTITAGAVEHRLAQLKETQT